MWRGQPVRRDDKGRVVTRAEHMAWAKCRALEYVDRGDLQNALASFASDMRKHNETSGNPVIAMLIATIGAMHAAPGHEADMRQFIEGFA